ncbi:MAG: tyrosinase family protein [Pseudomonadota bacterium]
MAVRQSIRGLERQTDGITLLRRAVGRMQSLSDDRGFDFFAALHGLALPQWCEHGTELFLPWHRAYLYYYELALQSRLAPGFVVQAPADPTIADVGLPWWDWTSEGSHADGIPESYDVAVVGGAQNPLAASTIGVGTSPLSHGVWSLPLFGAVRAQLPGAVTDSDPARTRRDPDVPGELPQASTIEDIVLQQNTFASFTMSVEQVHDDVHGWVGGSMSAVPTSAYDPIFWSHHCMIDRLWYLWQLSALGMDPPPQLLDRVLAPFPMTVRQTLDIATLNYDYAVEVIA